MPNTQKLHAFKSHIIQYLSIDCDDDNFDT